MFLLFLRPTVFRSCFVSLLHDFQLAVVALIVLLTQSTSLQLV